MFEKHWWLKKKHRMCTCPMFPCVRFSTYYYFSNMAARLSLTFPKVVGSNEKDILWDPTLVGESNETFLIKVWKPDWWWYVTGQNEQYLLVVGLGCYKWYQSQTRVSVLRERWSPREVGSKRTISASSGFWLLQMVSKLNTGRCATRTLALKRGGAKTDNIC